jgi:hypothetical protein
VKHTPLPTALASKDGKFHFPSIPRGRYELEASRVGYGPSIIEIDLTGEQVVYFYLAPALISHDMERDPGWTVGAPGDDATTGIWERTDPIGTESHLGRPAQPEDDRTPGDGYRCWITGQSDGASIGANDVDNGRTTLRTENMDLATTQDPVISYWTWYSNDHGIYDDEWLVQISNDDGNTWIDLLRTTQSNPEWILHEHRVREYVLPSPEVVVQFVAADENGGSIVEAAIDDFQVFEAGTRSTATARPETGFLLAQNHPNPFRRSTAIEFAIARAGPLDLRVFDVTGRLVRTLLQTPLQAAGAHTIRWDGRNAVGAPAASGVYWVRLNTPGRTATRRMVLIRDAGFE